MFLLSPLRQLRTHTTPWAIWASASASVMPNDGVRNGGARGLGRAVILMWANDLRLRDEAGCISLPTIQVRHLEITVKTVAYSSGDFRIDNGSGLVRRFSVSREYWRTLTLAFADAASQKERAAGTEFTRAPAEPRARYYALGACGQEYRSCSDTMLGSRGRFR